MLEFINSFLGIIVSILALCGVAGGVVYAITKRNKQSVKGNGISNNSEGNSSIMSGSAMQSTYGGVTVQGNNNTVVQSQLEGTRGKEQPNIVANLKNICQVLFIDDESLQTLIKTLRKAGWKNVKRIGDTANLDVEDIRNADIIFVDIKGVGLELRFKNEGVGLAAALKKKYPQKGIIIYSATAEHNLFDPDIDVVDGRLFKAAEPIQYSNMIEQYAKSKNQSFLN